MARQNQLLEQQTISAGNCACVEKKMQFQKIVFRPMTGQLVLIVTHMVNTTKGQYIGTEISTQKTKGSRMTLFHLPIPYPLPLRITIQPGFLLTLKAALSPS